MAASKFEQNRVSSDASIDRRRKRIELCASLVGSCFLKRPSLVKNSHTVGEKLPDYG